MTVAFQAFVEPQDHSYDLTGHVDHNRNQISTAFWWGDRGVDNKEFTAQSRHHVTGDVAMSTHTDGLLSLLFNH